jgi:hypothetical protein
MRQAAAPGSVRAPQVAPGTPVVTLRGVCQDLKAKTPCETTITRQDLDEFVEAATPDVAKMARSRQAIQYARSLAFSALAEQQGLAADPALAKELDAQVKPVRTRILANTFLENLQAQGPGIAESDIQSYYDQHRDRYEQVQVRRMAVPFVVPSESGHPLDRAAVKSEMEALRSRAVDGADLNLLQLDAYKHLHILATPPPVEVLTFQRVGLQGDEAKLFDLNPGEISAVLDLPAAFAVVKLESKDPAPIQSVRADIEAALRRDRLQNEVTKRTGNITAQFNLEYFDLPSQPDIFLGVTLVSPPASRASIRTAMAP